MDTSKQTISLSSMLVFFGFVCITSLGTGAAIHASDPANRSRVVDSIRRKADVETIYNAVVQHYEDNSKAWLFNVPTGACDHHAEICQGRNLNCSGLVNLTNLTDDATYLVYIPKDPKESGNLGTGYAITRDKETLHVCSLYDKEIMFSGALDVR